MRDMLLTITGPSGSGKTEILKRLCKNYNFAQLVSDTTRKPRPGERDGIDYYFTSELEFNRDKKLGNYMQTVEFQGNLYGTHVHEIEIIAASNKIPAVIVEPGGIKQFKEYCDKNKLELISAYVTADAQLLISRYLSRMAGDLDNDYHARRILGIVKEHDTWIKEHKYDIHLVNSSKDLQKIDTLAEMIYTVISDKSLGKTANGNENRVEKSTGEGDPPPWF